MRNLAWSNWQSGGDLDIDLEDIAREPGVYQVRLMSADGSVAPIGRILGIDKEGILYVGSHVRDVASRLLRFLNEADYHSGEQSYYLLRQVAKSWPFRLEGRYQGCDTSNETREEEQEELVKYFWRFGERFCLLWSD